MIRTTPFHERTSALNQTGLWEHWSNHLAAVRYQFATQRPGSRVPLTILRNGRQMTLTANAEAPPGGAPQARELAGRHPLSGARVVTLTPATAESSGLDPFKTGVFIQALDRGGVAARIGFRPGDIIDEINGQPIRDAAALDRAMAQNRSWVIGVERNGQVLVLAPRDMPAPQPDEQSSDDKPTRGHKVKRGQPAH